MFNDLKVLAVIPARGGSKGVPRKNLRKIEGKTLVERTVDIASKSKYIDRLVLSSDNEDIIENAKSAGCEIPFKRPENLSKDNSSTRDVILHTLENVRGYDLVVSLQVTSPLVKTEDVDACIFKCVSTDSKACVSACVSGKSPYWMFKIENNFLVPLMGNEFLHKRRQDLPLAYIPNGAVFVAYTEWFKKNKTFYSDVTTAHIMPEERSFDLDTEFDFLLVETFLKQKSNNNS
jgi:CMP-N-acetylneuraminic acid synthetase